MLAFGVSLGIFFAVSLLGLALIPGKISHFDKSLGIFLAPGLGLSVIIVIIFSVSRLGIPLTNVGLPLTATLIVLAVIRRQQISDKLISKSHTLKLLILPLGVLTTAWPILKYGFSWISYANDDMNNYVLAATRFLNHGYFTEPNALYYRGMDYSQLYYYMHVDYHVRPGSELFLALVSSVSHLAPIKIFMPTILALQIVLISSILALSRLSQYSSKGLTRIAYLLSIGLGMSSLGFLYQLIGQVGGIALGISFICLLALYFKIGPSSRAKWPFIVVAAAILCAEMIWYPEFLGFVAVICLVILVVNRSALNRQHGKHALILIALTIIVLNKYFFYALKFGVSQISSTQQSTDGLKTNAQLFPYFLNPHGLAAYLGLAPLSRWYPNPLESAVIIFSILLLFGLVLFALSKASIAGPASVGFVILFGVYCYLVFSSTGFGAFKMVMFTVPFLVVVIAEAIYLSYKKLRRISSVLLLVCLIPLSTLNLYTSQFYAIASTGTSSNGFAEIQGGSSENFTDMIQLALKKATKSNNDIISTSVNQSQIKLEAIAAQGSPLFFASTNPFENISNSMLLSGKLGYQKIDYPSVWGKNTFYQPNALIQNTKDLDYLVPSNKFEVFNQSSREPGSSGWSYKVVSSPSNRIGFINSSMGPAYYETNDRKKAAYFQPEKNPMILGKYMQSVGNDILIQAVGLTANPVLVMNISTTVIPQYLRKIPRIFVQGDSTQELGIEGRGSAQFLVPLDKPMVINGLNYYHIHIDQKLAPFPQKSSRISKLFGNKIERDARRISLFLNNLSIVDKSELSKPDSKNAISRFPEDLVSNAAEYSGIYEDGWIGKESYFVLSDLGKSQLEVSGSIPILESNPSFKTSIILSVDGKIYAKKNLLGGPFKVLVPWKSGISSSSLRKVSISFSNEQKLPAPDGRPASAQILFVGFK